MSRCCIVFTFSELDTFHPCGFGGFWMNRLVLLSTMIMNMEHLIVYYLTYVKLVNLLPHQHIKTQYIYFYTVDKRVKWISNAKGYWDSIALAKLYSSIFVQLKPSIPSISVKWPREICFNTSQEAIMFIYKKCFCLQKMHSIFIFVTFRNIWRINCLS